MGWGLGTETPRRDRSPTRLTCSGSGIQGAGVLKRARKWQEEICGESGSTRFS